MNAEPARTAKEVEEDLEAARKQSDALGEALDEAEDKHPPAPDTADNGDEP